MHNNAFLLSKSLSSGVAYFTAVVIQPGKCMNSVQILQDLRISMGRNEKRTMENIEFKL